MTYLLVRHKVEDFDAWKAVFDSHVQGQKDAGLGVERVLRNLDDPSEVVCCLKYLIFRRPESLLHPRMCLRHKQTPGS